MTSTINCPSCGAGLPHGTSRCPYCSTQLETASLSPEVKDAGVTLLRSANSDLDSLSSTRLMISLLLGVVAAPVAAYFAAALAGAGIILRCALAGAALLGGLLVVGSIVPGEEDRRFEKELKPRILAFREQNGMSAEDFLALARGELKESDPLLRQLEKLCGKLNREM